MQRLEAESHLCIQTSVGGVTSQQNGVGGVTLQQNLVLQGTSLVVEQETRKQKPVTGSSLYLRVSVGIFYCKAGLDTFNDPVAQLRQFATCR